MVFKRRNPRSYAQMFADAFYPRGGWRRAAVYVIHRLRRLPDPAHRISRAIAAGVFTSFTPFYGLHFLFSALVAWIMRGNIVASLLATFVGNPLTFVLIAASSLQTGYFLLGMGTPVGNSVERSLGGKFVDAGTDLKHNLWAVFTDEPADWSHLHLFYDEVFFPYMIGGLIPGLIAALIGYYVSLPVIQAYQNRRKGVLKAKLAALKEKAAHKADARNKPD